MLQFAQQDLVVLVEIGRPPGTRHQVDGLGRAAREDDFLGRPRADEMRQCLACLLVGGGGAFGQGVHAAVHVGVVMPVIAVYRLDHGVRLLGRGGIVQIHQGTSADILMQRGKIVAQDPRVGRGMHEGRVGYSHSSTSRGACMRAAISIARSWCRSWPSRALRISAAKP